MEEPEARVLVVPDHKLGTNDCRGWIRRSLFQRLNKKHDDELLSAQVARLRKERHGSVRDEDLDEQDRLILLHVAKQEIARKLLPSDRFYQFGMAFHNTQAKGSLKSWRMMLPTRWKRILCCRKAQSNQGSRYRR